MPVIFILEADFQMPPLFTQAVHLQGRDLNHTRYWLVWNCASEWGHQGKTKLSLLYHYMHIRNKYKACVRKFKYNFINLDFFTLQTCHVSPWVLLILFLRTVGVLSTRWFNLVGLTHSFNFCLFFEGLFHDSVCRSLFSLLSILQPQICISFSPLLIIHYRK